MSSPLPFDEQIRSASAQSVYAMNFRSAIDLALQKAMSIPINEEVSLPLFEISHGHVSSTTVLFVDAVEANQFGAPLLFLVVIPNQHVHAFARNIDNIGNFHAIKL